MVDDIKRYKIMTNEKGKKIYFCVDTRSYTTQMLSNHGACGYHDYLQARHAMEIGITPIVTSQMALMTFHQIGDYEAYICYKYRVIKIEEGMQLDDTGYCLSKPSCIEDHDILDVFINGYFNEMLGIGGPTDDQTGV